MNPYLDAYGGLTPNPSRTEPSPIDRGAFSFHAAMERGVNPSAPRYPDDAAILTATEM
jgi:hypothetical protein